MTRSLLVAFYLLLTMSGSAHAQEAMPFTRSWSVLGTKLLVTTWEADTVRSSRAVAQARAAVLRIDSLLFSEPGGAGAGIALMQGYAMDLAVDALRAEGVLRGSVELAGNARYFGKPPEGDVWGVAIRAPADEDQVLALVTMESGAVAGYGGPAAKAGAAGGHAMAIAATAVEAAARAATLFALGPVHGCALAEKLGWSGMWVGERRRGNELAPNIVVTSALRGTIQLQSAGGDANRPTVQPCPAAGGK